jgi:Xaa-Pro aminopeptidase
MSIYKERVSALRNQIRTLGFDALIIPHGGIWDKEHPQAHEQYFHYLTGFETSAGYVAVKAEKAAIFIDYRYAESAEKVIDKSLYDIKYYTEINPVEWLSDNLSEKQSIAIDPWLHSHKSYQLMKDVCVKNSLSLKFCSKNPVAAIWTDRPKVQRSKAVRHEIKYAGRTTAEKLYDVFEALSTQEVDIIVITAADSLAWLLNMRVLDNTTSPGVEGFAILNRSDGSAQIYTDCDLSDFNNSEAVSVQALDKFSEGLKNLGKHAIFIPNDAPYAIAQILENHENVHFGDDPCAFLKAKKNHIEQDNIRKSQTRDSRAVTKVIAYIKQTDKTLTEMDVADMLYQERAKDPLFLGVSFDTISSWNANGAHIHRSLKKGNNTRIEGCGFLLIDSGGQYSDGTTDITRTIAIGDISHEMKEKYTLVLKAHIALACAVFPVGTIGKQLDAIARAPLWAAGMDFAHGTGHGVGFFLNVHEGPCSISPRSESVIEEGMLLSNEPGYYKSGHYGIRLENLILVQPYMKADAPNNETGKDLLCFETVTKVPFEEQCILYDMLNEQEKIWLTNYN